MDFIIVSLKSLTHFVGTYEREAMSWWTPRKRAPTWQPRLIYGMDNANADMAICRLLFKA